jgi:hypothetical protein
VAYFYDADEKVLLTAELNKRGFRLKGDCVYDTETGEYLDAAEAEGLLDTLLATFA